MIASINIGGMKVEIAGTSEEILELISKAGIGQHPTPMIRPEPVQSVKPIKPKAKGKPITKAAVKRKTKAKAKTVKPTVSIPRTSAVAVQPEYVEPEAVIEPEGIQVHDSVGETHRLLHKHGTSKKPCNGKRKAVKSKKSPALAKTGSKPSNTTSAPSKREATLQAILSA